MTVSGDIAVKMTPSVYKYTMLGALAIVVAQQIYYPQPLKYFHLAILFAFIAFNDMRNHQYRDLTTDLLLVGAVVLSSLASVLEYFVAADISYLYKLFLTVSGAIAIKSFLDLRKIVRERRREMFTENAQKIFERSTLFIEYLLLGVCATIVIAVAYVLSCLLT